LARRPIPFGIHKFSIHPHLINLLQAERIIPQIGLAQTPSVGHDQVLKLESDLAEPVVYRLERRRDVLRIFVGLDFLDNIEAFFKKGGADRLRRRYDPSWPEELAIYSCSDKRRGNE
jgi:hypothetical protein